MVLADRNLVFYRIEDIILKPGELLDDVDCFRRVFVLIFNLLYIKVIGTLECCGLYLV